MENKLFLIGIKCPLSQLANQVSVVEEYGVRHVAYFDFWKNIVFIEYNQDIHQFVVKEIKDNKVQYSVYEREKYLFRHMDEENISFVGDNNPLGEIFRSYSAAYLALIQWVGDVAWTKEYYNSLLEG